MAALGNGILAFVVAAMICGILLSVAPASGKGWLQLLCGLVLTITLLKPLFDLRIDDFSLMNPSIQSEADSYSSQGEKKSQDAMADIISQKSQAYIMDKAAELGIYVEVQVTVNEETIPVPIFADLSGDITPYARLQVEALIQNDLGIPKENIRWIQ